MNQVSHGNSGTFDSFYWVEDDAGNYFKVDTQEFVANRDDATRFNAHGMIDVVEYIWNHMGFVDRNRIGVTGHSQGGVNKISAMFSQSCNEAVYAGEMDGVDVGYVVGYVDEIFLRSLNNEMPNGINTMPELLHYHANELVSNNTMYSLKPNEVADTGYIPGTYVYGNKGNIRVFHTNQGDHCVQHWLSAYQCD